MESVACPVDSVEVVVGGRYVEQISLPPVRERRDWPVSASGSTTVKVDRSTWIALRVRGSYRGQPNEIAAHAHTTLHRDLHANGIPHHNSPVHAPYRMAAHGEHA